MKDFLFAVTFHKFMLFLYQMQLILQACDIYLLQFSHDI